MSTPDEGAFKQQGEDSTAKMKLDSPTMCSTPAEHGERAQSPRPFALPSDSGVSQVFFPDDFENDNVSHRSVWKEPEKVKQVPIERAWRWTWWIKFMLFWILAFLLTAIVQQSMEQVRDFHNNIWSKVWEILDDYFPYAVLVCLFLVSSLLLFCYDCLKTPSLNITGPTDNSVLSPIPKYEKPVAGKAGIGEQRTARPSSRDFPCRRTFSGTGTDAWHDFRRYFENLAILNNWSKEESRRTLLCSLRGQAEAYAYGLPSCVQSDWDLLFSKMEQRFGIMNMKDSYVADTRLRRKQKNESYRKFGQAIEDLLRKAYPSNAEIVVELAVTTFLENCHESADFRLAVKRTRPKTLHDAITAAIQEECLRLTEREKQKNENRGNRVFHVGRRWNRQRNRFGFIPKSNSPTAPTTDGKKEELDQPKKSEN